MKLTGFLLMLISGWGLGRSIRNGDRDRCRLNIKFADLLDEINAVCLMEGRAFLEAISSVSELKEYRELIFLELAVEKNKSGLPLAECIESEMLLWAENTLVDRQIMNTVRTALVAAANCSPRGTEVLRDGALRIREHVKNEQEKKQGKENLYETVCALSAAAVGIMLI